MAANLFLASFIDCDTSQDSARDIPLTKRQKDAHQSSKKKKKHPIHAIPTSVHFIFRKSTHYNELQI